MGDDLLGATAALTYGDVTDLTNFGGAVIDERSFRRNAAAIDRAVEATLENGIHTADIAVDRSRAVGTAAMGDAIVAAL